MAAIKQSPSQKAAAKKQERAVFLGVITHQCHRTGHKAKQGCDGFEQGVQFSVALPRRTVGGDDPERKDQSEKNVDNAPLSRMVWPQTFHSKVIGKTRRFV
jgi:hypothetical protein